MCYMNTAYTNRSDSKRNFTCHKDCDNCHEHDQILKNVMNVEPYWQQSVREQLPERPLLSPDNKSRPW